MIETYDYIIVGVGSAGCVLAYRLSADARHSVLLVEAGPEDTSPYIPIPKGFGKTLRDPKLAWYFAAEPEPGNANQPYVWVRGKTLGGSSAVNGMIYVRGQPSDYDDWEAAGCTGWGWVDMLATFKAIENHELGEDEFRGGAGPLKVSIQNVRTPLTEAIIAAAAEVGLPFRQDLNRPQLEGIGYTPCTIWKGRRQSAAQTFLKPIRRRANLHILTDTVIDRLRFDGTCVVGVDGRRHGASVGFGAAREVIVCAGAIQSPKLLQLSGVGPARELRELGIPVVHDLPGVGANLREHKLTMLQWKLAQPLSINRALCGWRLCASAAQWLLARRGPLATTYDLNAFIRSSPQLDRPDCQLTISSFSLQYDTPAKAFEKHHGMSIFGYPLRTESKGVLRLRCADPDEPPLIRANYLSDERDRRATVDMVRFVRRMVAQPPLRSFVQEETWGASCRKWSSTIS